MNFELQHINAVEVMTVRYVSYIVRTSTTWWRVTSSHVLIYGFHFPPDVSHVNEMK